MYPQAQIDREFYSLPNQCFWGFWCSWALEGRYIIQGIADLYDDCLVFYWPIWPWDHETYSLCTLFRISSPGVVKPRALSKTVDVPQTFDIEPNFNAVFVNLRSSATRNHTKSHDPFDYLMPIRGYIFRCYIKVASAQPPNSCSFPRHLVRNMAMLCSWMLMTIRTNRQLRFLADFHESSTDKRYTVILRILRFFRFSM